MLFALLLSAPLACFSLLAVAVPILARQQNETTASLLLETGAESYLQRILITCCGKNVFETGPLTDNAKSLFSFPVDCVSCPFCDIHFDTLWDRSRPFTRSDHHMWNANSSVTVFNYYSNIVFKATNIDSSSATYPLSCCPFVLRSL